MDRVMRIFKKIAGLLLIAALLIQLGLMDTVMAFYDDTPQLAPTNLKLDDKATPPIGFDEFSGYFFNLTWEKAKEATGSVATFLNFYLQEINKPYRPSKPIILRDRDVSNSETRLRMSGLTSGTIYYVYMTAYHTHVDGTTTYTSAESVPSNRAKILTDIKINAYTYGTNKIKIEWDDVCDANGRRIDYKLYVSENSSFTNTPPIYIGQQQIGQDKPVTVNTTTGKLEYMHTVRDPGRVYYVKIVPDVNDPELKRSPESETVAVSSYILARTSKISANDFGTVWRLDWSPVVTGLSGGDIKISYQVYKGTLGTTDLPQYMAAVDDTSFFVTLGQKEESTYYIIRALVTRNGEDVYQGIRIESDRIIVQEQQVPAYPPTPELVDEFEGIISYAGLLTPHSATVLWRVPRKATGQIDTDTTYDIWLLSDPNVIDKPPDSTKIASSMKMGANNNITNGAELVGYKYALSSLTANSTYYFKIVAKKTFVDYVDGKLVNVEYASQPAIRVIITPAEGNIDQPKVPGRPPFKLKKSAPPESKDMVTETSAVVQLKNKWYEKFNEETRRWEYVRTEKLNPGDTPDYIPDEVTLDDLQYRMVEYDPGVTIDVGCIKFMEGMSYEDLNTIAANKMTGVPVTANDPNEDKTLNPDKLKHNVDITVNGLEPNTTYIIWVRAARLNPKPMLSGPSDPIIVTTKPRIEEPVEKPTVPEFNYGLAEDTFADLGWNFKSGYTYYIKYGTEEDIRKAKKSVTVTPKDLQFSTFYRINGLDPSTIYYFWIQAEATNTAGVKSQSEWSDSFALKTLPYLPPETPMGFGIKSGAGSITKDSITFEWLQEDNLEYILEVAGNIDYKDLTEFKAGKASEYKVDKLRSNYRYYARLYAYDPVKKMKSAPTASITVRTERSKEEYDSDQDIETVISGDYIIKADEVVDGVWNISITGVNADRFIEYVRKDNTVDYMLDLSKPPEELEKISITVSHKVFKAMDVLKENLILEIGNSRIIIRPGMLGADLDKTLSAKLGDFNYEIAVLPHDTATDTGVKNMTFKTGATGVQIGAKDGGSQIPVTTLNKPLKISFPYTGKGWYKEGTTSAFAFDPDLGLWKRLSTTATYNEDSGKGRLSADMDKPGSAAVAELGNSYFDDIAGHWAETSIIGMTQTHKLKSVAGRTFDPDAYASKGEVVKFVLDVMDYSYGGDYMMTAAKAGIIGAGDASSPDSYCTREKAIAMITRLYEKKTGKPAKPSNSDVTYLDDLDSVSPGLYPAVKFAVENGLVIGKGGNTLQPQAPVTRAEAVAMLHKLLVFTGELE